MTHILLIARRLVALGGFCLGDLCAYGLNLGGDSGAVGYGRRVPAAMRGVTLSAKP